VRSHDIVFLPGHFSQPFPSDNGAWRIYEGGRDQGEL
jgi:hypothetical protein